MSTSESNSAPSLAPGDSVARRRRIARDLLTEAEAVGRLLESETSALGTNEILFLRRLRSSLLSKAEELTQMTDEPAPARRRALPSAAEPRMELRPVPEPSAAAENRSDRGALEMARVVVVSYLMFLFAFMGYLFAKSHLLRVDVSGEISDMLKVFLVPLVLLLLGFFFGSSRR